MRTSPSKGKGKRKRGTQIADFWRTGGFGEKKKKRKKVNRGEVIRRERSGKERVQEGKMHTFGPTEVSSEQQAERKVGGGKVLKETRDGGREKNFRNSASLVSRGVEKGRGKKP